ncbi:MAG: hypothetical protein FWE35_26470 [Streptosporangiales bacterium]|nr:hypothetical protein [Streptosporangiales bacterium]
MTDQQNTGGTGPDQEPQQDPGQQDDDAQQDPGTDAQDQTGDKPPDDVKELRAALASMRKERVALQRQLDDLQRQSMSDAEKAIAEAREQGRTEAATEAGKRIAAAEFRTAAAGKLSDPDAALEMLDLSRFIGDDGEPDRDAIKQAVERLTPAAAPASPKVPAGPRDTQPETDFIRSRLAGRRG